MLGEPLLQLDDLERVGGGNQRLGQELVGIQGDRRHQRVELFRREFHRGLRGGAVRRLGVLLGQNCLCTGPEQAQPADRQQPSPDWRP